MRVASVYQWDEKVKFISAISKGDSITLEVGFCLLIGLGICGRPLKRTTEQGAVANGLQRLILSLQNLMVANCASILDEA